MTNEMMSLRALVEKTPDADILREMIGFAAMKSALRERRAPELLHHLLGHDPTSG